MRVAIVGHWHAGTSLLAQTLAACGMQIGNPLTFWVPNPQYEHALLNELGDAYLLGKMPAVTVESLARTVLRAYNREAARLDWKCCGIKVTHALHAPCWPIFRRVFREEWPDCRFVLADRCLAAIAASTAHDLAWPLSRVKESYRSCQAAIAELQGDIVVRYPESYLSNQIQDVVESLGLRWNDKAAALFDVSRIRRFSELDLYCIYNESANTA